jgi:hypothetical protein
MRKTAKLLATVVLILTSLIRLSAASGKATVLVTATVMPKLSQSILYQESGVTISEEDLRKGYVEVRSATILEVKTNNRDGYWLLFEGFNELFKEVWVQERGRTTVLSPNGGLVHQADSRGNLEIKDLSYKFYLEKNVRPGRYPWPFRVKASLL